MLTKLKLSSVLTVALLSCLGSFGQLSYEVRVGAPVNVNKHLADHLAGTYGLKKSSSFGFNGGIVYDLKRDYYIFAEIQLNDYFFNQDTLALRLPQVNSVGGVGKKVLLTDKLRIGIQIDLGACLSTQHWYATPGTISYFQSFNKSKYSVSVTDAQAKFYLGTDVYLSYKIGQSLNLFIGIKSSILPMRKLDRIDGQPLYGFYICPYIGLRGIRIK